MLWREEGEEAGEGQGEGGGIGIIPSGCLAREGVVWLLLAVLLDHCPQGALTGDIFFAISDFQHSKQGPFKFFNKKKGSRSWRKKCGPKRVFRTVDVV